MAVSATMPLPVSVRVPMPTGSLEAYIQTVNRFPILTAEEEARFARRFRDEGDLEAARQLVLSHLRLVVALAIVALALWLLDAEVRSLAESYGSEFRFQFLALREAGAVIAFAGLLGWLGAQLSVGRHLREIEPS